MDIWIIRNGEKYGPLPDYQIREKIEAGDIDATSPAWHEGLPAWIPISQIQIFENSFRTPAAIAPTKAVDEIFDDPSATDRLPPPIPGKPKLIRRFCARWIDLSLYLSVWWLFLWVTGRDVEGILANNWVSLSQFAPWFALEIYLIHRFATTPGKWLLGIRVLNADGSYLDFTESTRRTLRCYVVGIGLGWPLVSIFCMILSLFTSHRLGAPLWDYLGKHRVEYKPLNALRIISAITVYLIASGLQFGVLAPYTMKPFLEDLTAPEMQDARKSMEQQLKSWTFPRRHP